MNRRTFLSILGTSAMFRSWVYAAERAEFTPKDLLQFTPISDGILRAPVLTMFEGLPHPTWEAEQLKRELARKKVVRRHKYPFYERPLAIDASEIELLRRLCAATDSYSSYGGEKLCGGYHPDYCLAWQDGEASYDLLICFGCHEMKLYGPKHELLADIRGNAFKQFEAALKRHRVQRSKAK